MLAIQEHIAELADAPRRTGLAYAHDTVAWTCGSSGVVGDLERHAVTLREDRPRVLHRRSFPGTVLVHSFFMKNTWYVKCGMVPEGGMEGCQFIIT